VTIKAKPSTATTTEKEATEEVANVTTVVAEAAEAANHGITVQQS